MTGISNRVLLSIGLVVLAVGIVDSLISREWDLLVVFVVAGLIQLSLWMRQLANRRPVTLRPDLTQWVEQRAQRTGEPFDDMLDRAVAYYKHGLYVPDTDARGD